MAAPCQADYARGDVPHPGYHRYAMGVDTKRERSRMLIAAPARRDPEKRDSPAYQDPHRELQQTLTYPAGPGGARLTAEAL